MKVSMRVILKDKSNQKMSANLTESDSKMTDSKSSMTLRKKASVKENRSVGTNSEKAVTFKKSKKDNTCSKETSSKNIKGVLIENNENQKISSAPQINNSVKSDMKAYSNDSGMEKHVPTLKRPRRGLKTPEESFKENVSLGIVPPKSRKRKRYNEENSNTVLNVNINKEGKGIYEKQISLSKVEEEIQILSKSFEDISDSSNKGSDYVKLCCHETNTPINNLESLPSECKAIEVTSNLVTKPNTRSTKGPVARKKHKGDYKSIELDASNSNSLKRVKSVRIQAKKKCETLSKSNSTCSKMVDNQTEAGFAKDKYPKQKVAAKTLKKSKKTSIKCKSEGKITNYFNAEVLSEEKISSSKTPSVPIQTSDHIPIYKKANELIEAKRFKKYSRVSDVYNIENDEDMRNSPQFLKKKPQKATKKSKSSKSKIVVSKPQSVRAHKKSKTIPTTSCVKTVKDITVPVQNTPSSVTSNPHQANEDVMDVDPIIPDSTHMAEELPMHSHTLNKNVQKKTNSDKSRTVLSLTCTFGKEKLKNPTLLTPEKQSDLQRISKLDAKFVLASSSPVPNEREPANLTSETPDQELNKYNGEKSVMTFLSDFEASFQRPHMTSTPDNTDLALPVKKTVISKKHPAVRMLEISSIPPIKCVQEPSFVSDVEFESPEKIDLSEITLFESPTKSEEDKTKETSHQKKGRKKCQTKLNFGKSNKTVQKNESEKISSFLSSTHSNPETAHLSGENLHPKSPQRVLREKKTIVPEEIELSEDESDFEDELFRSYSDNEDAREKENVSNNSSTSPVKYLEVLKPRTSYSPSVKPCFSRTKKATLPVKQYVSKEEKLIQSMNEHFSELDSLELCIE